MRGLVNGILVAVSLLYPPAVHFGIHYFEPRYLASALALLLLARLTIGTGSALGGKPLIVASLGFCGLAFWLNEPIALRFYPVLINLTLLIVFAAGLFFPPPIIERLARLRDPALPPQAVPYIRKVTQVWCVFFLTNGSIAAATALWSSFEFWSLYNGLIAYILMGLLMAGEYWVRLKVQDHVR
ncbi:MAG: hypothetical protein ACU84J_10335 [Gammaproteobacteria bacterium]